MLTGRKINYLNIEEIDECQCDICKKITIEPECFGSAYHQINSNINNKKIWLHVSLTQSIVDNIPDDDFHICDECMKQIFFIK